MSLRKSEARHLICLKGVESFEKPLNGPRQGGATPAGRCVTSKSLTRILKRRVSEMNSGSFSTDVKEGLKDDVMTVKERLFGCVNATTLRVPEGGMGAGCWV